MAADSWLEQGYRREGKADDEIGRRKKVFLVSFALIQRPSFNDIKMWYTHDLGILKFIPYVDFFRSSFICTYCSRVSSPFA